MFILKLIYIYIVHVMFIYQQGYWVFIIKQKNLNTDKFILKLETFVHKKNINYLTTI